MDDAGKLSFPAAPHVPALYRLRLIARDGTRHYIGEAINLKRRFGNYRNPGPTQATSLRINEVLVTHLAAGGQVEVDFIAGDIMLSVGGRSRSFDLADKATRRLLEQAAVVANAGKHDPGLAAVESVANLCSTSLTATAIRYAELSEDAVAVIISTGPTIDYCCLSNLMKSLPQLAWLKKGTPVPQGTATAELNASPSRIANAERTDAEIDIVDWLGGRKPVASTEEVIGLGGYGKTLTILTCPSLVDETYRDEDPDDEEDLIERWTPRFRR